MRKIVFKFFIIIALLLVVVLVSVPLTYWIYTSVMATDWPDWVKYLLLH